MNFFIKLKKYFKKNVIKLSIIATMSSLYSTSRLIVNEWLATKNYESPTKLIQIMNDKEIYSCRI